MQVDGKSETHSDNLAKTKVQQFVIKLFEEQKTEPTGPPVDVRGCVSRDKREWINQFSTSNLSLSVLSLVLAKNQSWPSAPVIESMELSSNTVVVSSLYSADCPTPVLSD